MKYLHNCLYKCFHIPIGKYLHILRSIHSNTYSRIRYFHCNRRHYHLHNLHHFHYHHMKTGVLQMPSKRFHIQSMLFQQL